MPSPSFDFFNFSLFLGCCAPGTFYSLSINCANVSRGTFFLLPCTMEAEYQPRDKVEHSQLSYSSLLGNTHKYLFREAGKKSKLKLLLISMN